MRYSCQPLRRVELFACWIVLLWLVPTPAKEPGSLGFVAKDKEFQFNTGVLRGTLHQGGKALGIGPLRDVASDSSLAGAFGILSPYRMLTADARFGTAGWDWASEAKRRADGSVAVSWTPDKVHPLEMTAVYRLAAANVIDVQFTVKPQQDLRHFELFLASYFQGFPTSLVYAKDQSGKDVFLEATRANGDWQTFPRDDEAVRIYGDGRWQRPPNPVDWKIRPKLAAPLALRRDTQRGWTAVLMAPAGDCFAISTPHGEDGHRSVYLSLFGRDLKAGKEVRARARLVMGRRLSDQQAIDLYKDFIR